MSAWGTAIFSDDTASDVREDYREFIGDGLSGPEATNRLLQEWADQLDDPDESPVFWLALAATQWTCGRLELRVQKKALEVIESGANLIRWADDPKLLNKRHSVLTKLADQLRQPPPPEKRIPRRFRDHCNWDVGEVIGYHLQSGNWALFRVIAFHRDKGGTSPICELLDWIGTPIPSALEISKLAVRRTGPDVITRRPNEIARFMLGRTSEKELPITRLIRLGIKLEPSQKPPENRGRVVWPVGIYLWRNLDEDWKRDYDIN